MKVSRLAERTDEILPRVLQAGGEVVEAKVRTNLQSVIGSGIKEESRSTGELVGALGVSSAKQDRDGNFNVKVGFSEPRLDGKANADCRCSRIWKARATREAVSEACKIRQ